MIQYCGEISSSLCPVHKNKILYIQLKYRPDLYNLSDAIARIICCFFHYFASPGSLISKAHTLVPIIAVIENPVQNTRVIVFLFLYLIVVTHHCSARVFLPFVLIFVYRFVSIESVNASERSDFAFRYLFGLFNCQFDVQSHKTRNCIEQNQV